MSGFRGVINLAWHHNSYYQPRLLRALPARCERVLDVGCGAGDFAIRLAERAGRVDAVDRSAGMIEAARRAVPANVTCWQGDVAEMTLPAGAYDAITSISALHHMSLPTVLPRLAQALRPGGLLVAIALYRLDVPRDLPLEAVSMLANFSRRGALICLPPDAATAARCTGGAPLGRRCRSWTPSSPSGRDESGNAALPNCPGAWWRRRPTRTMPRRARRPERGRRRATVRSEADLFDFDLLPAAITSLR
jgi:SAM-dependent methyltransferase